MGKVLIGGAMHKLALYIRAPNPNGNCTLHQALPLRDLSRMKRGSSPRAMEGSG
jgi:hypothetical protein